MMKSTRIQHYLKGLFTLVAVCGIYGTAFAQIEVLSALDSTNVLIGDQIYLKVMANHAPGLKVEEADISSLGEVADLEVLKVEDWDTLALSPQTIIEQKILITAFDTGQVWIPSIPVKFSLSGNTSVINTDPVLLNVIPIAVDSMELAPIKEIIAEPITWEDWLSYLLGIVGALFLGFLVFYWLKRRGKAEEFTVVKPVIKEPAHIIAFRRLTALRKKELWQKEEIKAYHSELTYIFREYLENRYDIQALENTTSEVLGQLKKEGFSEEQKRKTSDLLQTADLVKFAKSKPGPDVHESALVYVEDFIKETQFVAVESIESSSENLESNN